MSTVHASLQGCMLECVHIPLCVLVQTAQREKTRYGISKIISLPDGKTSHIPFEVPHMICACVCVVGGISVLAHNYYWIT